MSKLKTMGKIATAPAWWPAKQLGKAGRASMCLGLGLHTAFAHILASPVILMRSLRGGEAKKYEQHLKSLNHQNFLAEWGILPQQVGTLIFRVKFELFLLLFPLSFCLYGAYNVAFNKDYGTMAAYVTLGYCSILAVFCLVRAARCLYWWDLLAAEQGYFSFVDFLTGQNR